MKIIFFQTSKKTLKASNELLRHFINLSNVSYRITSKVIRLYLQIFQVVLKKHVFGLAEFV